MILKTLMILCVCLVMLGTVAMAKDAPVVTRVDPADIPTSSALNGDGTVGNLNPAYWVVHDWVLGLEAYKYLFNPAEQLDCQVGFQLTMVHMMLQFAEEATYPVDFSMYVDLETAQWDPTVGCWVPGPEECVSLVYDLSIAQAGLYDISLPIDCDCAYLSDPTGMPFWYLLSVHFPTEFQADLVIDDVPLACYSWNDWGDGWYDLVVDYELPGGVIMFGDVNCCTDPVEVEEKSWGGIKSLYR